MSASPAALLLWLLPSALGANGLRPPWALACASALLYLLWLRRPPAGPPAGRLWLAWAAWGLLSAASSAEPLTGLSALSRAALGPAFFALASSSWRAPHRRLWLWGLLLCAQALGVSAWLLSVPSYAMTGLLVYYYNYTACLQAAAVCAAVAAWLSDGSRPARQRAALAVCGACSLAWIVRAGSRGALLACAVVALAWLLRFRRWRPAGAVAFAAASAVSAFLAGSRPERLLKLNHFEPRPRIWASALAVCGDHPFLGQGPGQFERGFLRHNFPVPAGVGDTRFGMRTAHAHSEPLQLAAEWGWPGLILWILALAAALAEALRAAGRDPSREAPLAAAACIFLQCLIDNLLYLPAVSLVFYSALAAASGRARFSPRSERRPSLALGAAGLVLCCWAWWPQWSVQSRLERAAAAGGTPEAAAWARGALAVQPDNSDIWQDLARYQLLQSPPRRADALQSLIEAEQRNPTGGDIPLVAAEVLRDLGRWRETAQVAQRALQLEPEALQARLQRAEAWLRLGDRSRAARELEEIRSLRASLPSRVRNTAYSSMVHRFDSTRLDALLRETRGR